MYEKKVRNLIEAELEITHKTVLQDRPYTAVKITAVFEHEEHEAIGFTKVNWPDKWNAEYGIDMAIDKATAKITKRILAAKKEHISWPLYAENVLGIHIHVAA